MHVPCRFLESIIPGKNINRVLHTYRLLDEVKYVQDTLIDYAVFRKTLPLLSRKNVAVGLEVLSLVDLLLFNANNKAQVCTTCNILNTPDIFMFPVIIQGTPLHKYL